MSENNTPIETKDSPAKEVESNVLLTANIFKDIKQRHHDQFMKYEKVSLHMLMERDALYEKIDWAIRVIEDYS